jgi:hypothetical protein
MRKRLVLSVLAAVLITACGQNTRNVALKPTASAGASTEPTAESTPLPSPLPVGFNLICRLPVTGDSETPRNRGWITFPGGQFTPDPSKQSNGSYDWAIHAWVPVGQNYVATDGATYVVANDAFVIDSIYIVNARTGTRRRIVLTQGWSGIAQYSAGRLYMYSFGGGSDAPTNAKGLWVLDPRTGRSHVIGATHSWDMVGPGFAWATEDNSYNGGSVTVFRLDLATGKSMVWYVSKTSVTALTPTPYGELLVDFGIDNRLALLGQSRAVTFLDLPQGYDDSASWSLARPGAWLSEATSADMDLFTLNLYMKGAGVKRMAGGPYPGPLYAAGDCR